MRRCNSVNQVDKQVSHGVHVADVVQQVLRRAVLSEVVCNKLRQQIGIGVTVYYSRQKVVGQHEVDADVFAVGAHYAVAYVFVEQQQPALRDVYAFALYYVRDVAAANIHYFHVVVSVQRKLAKPRMPCRNHVFVAKKSCASYYVVGGDIVHAFVKALAVKHCLFGGGNFA